MKQKKIAIFGSTGSIGTSSLEVVRKFPDQLQVYALAAHSNIDELEKQIREFNPKVVAVFDEEKAAELQGRFPNLKVLSGPHGLCEIAQLDEINFVLMAMSGNQGLLPLVKAIECHKQIGLANKEVLISAGQYITELAHKHAVNLLPIDSEHSALFQCLQGENPRSVKRLILTASGGPFRNYPSEKLSLITPEDALNHPTWNMGPKITIDSSTLMNKGLEVIEAFWLFNIPIEKIDVIVHPQSIIHSMVEFVDGSIKAQMSRTSMQMPIQYALFYPERMPNDEPAFDFLKYPSLEFSSPDIDRFLCLQLAFEAIKTGKSMPCFMNSANEILVKRFLNREIHWHEIGEKLQTLMSFHQVTDVLDLKDILSVDEEAKTKAELV